MSTFAFSITNEDCLPSAITITTSSTISTTATSLRRRWTSVTCHLNSQFPAVKHATVHSFKCIFSISLVVESTRESQINLAQPTLISFDQFWSLLTEQKQSRDSLLYIGLLEYKYRPLHRIARKRDVGHPASYGKLGYQPVLKLKCANQFSIPSFTMFETKNNGIGTEWTKSVQNSCLSPLRFHHIRFDCFFHFRRHCECVAYVWIMSATNKMKSYLPSKKPSHRSWEAVVRNYCSSLLTSSDSQCKIDDFNLHDWIDSIFFSRMTMYTRWRRL